MAEMIWKIGFDRQDAKRAGKEAGKEQAKESSKGKGGGGAFAGGLLGSLLGNILTSVKSLIDPITAIAGLLIAALFPLIKPFLILFLKVGLLLFKFLQDPAKAIKSAFEFLATSIGEFLGIDVDKVNSLIQSFNTVVDLVSDVFMNAIGIVSDLAKGDFSGAFERVKQIFMQQLPQLAAELISFVGQLFITVFEGILSFIDSKLGTNFLEIFQSLKGIFMGLVDFMSAFFSGDWKAAWNALKDIGKFTFKLITALMALSLTVLKGIGTVIYEAIKVVVLKSLDALKGLGEWLNDKIRGAIDFGKDLGSKVKEGAGGLFSKAKDFFVNDAIITPNNDVIRTNPSDFLIATKDPGSLMGGGSGASANVNVTINGGLITEEVARDIGKIITRDVNFGGGF